MTAFHCSLSILVNATTDDLKCCVCGDDSSAPPNEIIICDQCTSGYHQNCVDPPVPASEVGSPNPWLCTDCKKGMFGAFLSAVLLYFFPFPYYICRHLFLIDHYANHLLSVVGNQAESAPVKPARSKGAREQPVASIAGSHGSDSGSEPDGTQKRKRRSTSSARVCYLLNYSYIYDTS